MVAVGRIALMGWLYTSPQHESPGSSLILIIPLILPVICQLRDTSVAYGRCDEIGRVAEWSMAM